jgi:hypothetical protein
MWNTRRWNHLVAPSTPRKIIKYMSLSCVNEHETSLYANVGEQLPTVRAIVMINSNVLRKEHLTLRLQTFANAVYKAVFPYF